MRIRELALTSVAFATFVGMAGAQGTGERHAFSEVDADGDGAVTLAELQTAFEGVETETGGAESVLEAQDTNGDGVISPDEAGADMAIYSLEEESEEDDG